MPKPTLRARCHVASAPVERFCRGAKMPEVEVHFTEYFDGDAVTISTNGRTIYAGADIKTDLRTGLARIVKVTVSEGRPALAVEVTSKNVSATATFDAADLHHLIVALSGRDLKVTPLTKSDYEREPRGYA
jgi:hypothetical protein